MEEYELSMILPNLAYIEYEHWEMTRTLAFLEAQTHSRKKLKIKDILQFKWDNEDPFDEEKKPIINEAPEETAEEKKAHIERLKKQMAATEKSLNAKIRKTQETT